VVLVGNGLHSSVEDVYTEDYDGSGFSLHTPAVLITGMDTHLLKEALESSQTIKLQLNLEIAHSSTS
jgi:hypothetical protein